MRKNYIKCFLLAALIGMTGCNDFLDVDSKSQFSEDVVFSKEETASGMVNGIYHYFGETNSYRSRLISYMGINTDSEMQVASVDASESAQDRRSMAVYLQNANLADGFNNTDGKEPWSYLYAAIEHCNLCISGIREYGNPAPGNRMGELLGEALTLRAFFYFDLIKYWGDVPARFTPLTKDDLFVPKSDRTVIYDQIIADLGEAGDLLPWAGGSATASSVERVSKGFAKGLRARIALSAAGKALVRQDRSHVGGGDPGKIDYVFGEAAKRTQLYNIVKNECVEVIGAGKHPLASSFEQLWREVMNDEISVGRESMFEIGFKSSRGQHGRLLGALSSVTKYTQKEVSPYVVSMPTLFYDYADGDSRRDVTLVPYKYVLSSTKLTGGDTKNGFQDISDITKICFGKYRTAYRDYEKNGPLKGDDWGTNFPVMRSADLYLMAAEAINELEGPANAKQYLVDVRNRAFGVTDGNLGQYATYGLDTKEGFLKAIQEERKLEFANELIRKQDLIRWGILKEKLDETRTNLLALREGTGKYQDVHKVIYYRLKNSEELEIRGLNSADDVSDCIAADGWISKTWAAEESTNSETGVKSARLSDEWIGKSVYQGDPEKRQLLPIVSRLIEGSNGMLKNDYGY